MSCSLPKRLGVGLGALLVSTLECFARCCKGRNNDDVTDKTTSPTQVTTAGLSAERSAPKADNDSTDNTASSVTSSTVISFTVKATDRADADGREGISGEDRRGNSPNPSHLEDVVHPKESPKPLLQNPSSDTVLIKDQNQQSDASRSQTCTALLPISDLTHAVLHIGALPSGAPPMDIFRGSRVGDAEREVQQHRSEHPSSSATNLVGRLDRVRQRCRSMRTDLDSLSSRCDNLFSELEAIRARLARKAGSSKLHWSRAVVPVARASWSRYPETPRVNEPGQAACVGRRLFLGSSILMLSPPLSQVSHSWSDAGPQLRVATRGHPTPSDTERFMTSTLLKKENWVFAGSALERRSCAVGAELRLDAGSARAITYHGTSTKDCVSASRCSTEVNELNEHPGPQPSAAFIKCEKRHDHDYPTKGNSPDHTGDRDPTEDENTPMIEALTCLESFTDSGKLKPCAVAADYRALRSSTMVHTPPTSDESSGSVDICSTGNLLLLTVSGSQFDAPEQHDIPCEQQAKGKSREGNLSPSVAESATPSEERVIRKSGFGEIAIRISQLSCERQMERRDGISDSILQSESPSPDHRQGEATEGDMCSSDDNSEREWKDYCSPSYWCDSLHTSYLLTPDTNSDEPQNTARMSVSEEQSQHKTDGNPLLEPGITDVLNNGGSNNKVENLPVSDSYSSNIYDVFTNDEGAYYHEDGFSRDKLFDKIDSPVAEGDVLSISVTRTASLALIVSSPPVSTYMPTRSQKSSESSNSKHFINWKNPVTNNLRLKTSLIPRPPASVLKRKAPVSDCDFISDEGGYPMMQKMTSCAEQANAGVVVTWSNPQTARRVSHATIMLTLNPVCLPRATQPPANAYCQRSVVKARKSRKPRVRSYNTLEDLSCSLNFMRTRNWPVLAERDRKPCYFWRGLRWSRFASGGGRLYKTCAPNTEQNLDISPGDPFVCSCQSKQFHSGEVSRMRIANPEELAVRIQKASQATVAEPTTAAGVTKIDSSQARKRRWDAPGRHRHWPEKTVTNERCASFNLCQDPRRKGETTRVVPRAQAKRDLSCIVEDASKEMDEEGVSAYTASSTHPASSNEVAACTSAAATALPATQEYSGENEFSQTSEKTTESSVIVINGMDTPEAVSTQRIVPAAITSKLIKPEASVKSSELNAQVSLVKSELISEEARATTLNAGSLPSPSPPLSPQAQTWPRGTTGDSRFAPDDAHRAEVIQPAAFTTVNRDSDAKEERSLRQMVDSKVPDTSSTPMMASKKCTPFTSTPIVSCTQSRNPPTHDVLSPVFTQTDTADQSAILDASGVSGSPPASSQSVSPQANLLAAFQESLCQPAGNCSTETTKPLPSGLLQTTYIISIGVAQRNPLVSGGETELCGSKANREKCDRRDCSSFLSQLQHSGLASESAVDSIEDNGSSDDDYILNVKRRKMDDGRSSAGFEMKHRDVNAQYPETAVENSTPSAEDNLLGQVVGHTAGNEATAKAQSRPKPLLPTPAFRRPPPPTQRRPTCLQGVAKCGHWPCSLAELPVHHAHWAGCCCAVMDRLILEKPVVNERRGDWRKQQEEWCCAQGKPYNGPATRCAVQGGVTRPQPRLLVP